ncbi:unnamed protein product [Chrysoparadoxa australica]
MNTVKSLGALALPQTPWQRVATSRCFAPTSSAPYPEHVYSRLYSPHTISTPPLPFSSERPPGPAPFPFPPSHPPSIFPSFFQIDFKIGEESSVYEAIQRFAAYNIGALAVADSAGRVTGIVSERDYVCKVALLGRQSQNTKIKEVATMGPNVVMAKKSDTVQDCMKKMLSRDIRHLPIIDDDSGEVVGLLSIKDLIKEVAREKENLIHKISDFKLGKGGFLDHGI